jgi:hypothetical protein
MCYDSAFLSSLKEDRWEGWKPPSDPFFYLPKCAPLKLRESALLVLETIKTLTLLVILVS